MPSALEKVEAFKLGIQDQRDGIFRPVPKDVEMDYRRGWLMEMAGELPEDFERIKDEGI